MIFFVIIWVFLCCFRVLDLFILLWCFLMGCGGGVVLFMFDIFVGGDEVRGEDLVGEVFFVFGGGVGVVGCCRVCEVFGFSGSGFVWFLICLVSGVLELEFELLFLCCCFVGVGLVGLWVIGWGFVGVSFFVLGLVGVGLGFGVGVVVLLLEIFEFLMIFWDRIFLFLVFLFLFFVGDGFRVVDEVVGLGLLLFRSCLVWVLVVLGFFVLVGRGFEDDLVMFLLFLFVLLLFVVLFLFFDDVLFVFWILIFGVVGGGGFLVVILVWRLLRYFFLFWFFGVFSCFYFGFWFDNFILL